MTISNSRRRVSRASGAILAATLFFTLSGLGAGAAPDNSPATDPESPSKPDVTTSTSSAATEPLVIVLDISGSMTEDDGTGTVRLDGAKTALTDVVRRQPDGTPLSLWTYPHTEEGCSPGGYVHNGSPDDESSPSDLIATIRELQANGGTPTGEALRAVAADLKARHETSATVLLVSDGESNCPVDPCDVAKELVASGFDITVQAMGFQISDKGRAELECIATATNGGYYDVKDSEELGQVLDEVSVPALTLDVTAAGRVPAGSATEISAVVKNPSAKDIKDVSLSLTFTGEKASNLFPAALPPRFRLGNIPAGGSVARSWTLSTAGGESGEADWRISAWTPEVGATFTAGTIGITDGPLTLTDAGQLLTQASAAGPTVILGDSYSSGEGTGEYLEADSKEEFACHRSNLTHGALLFGADTTSIIACSGGVSGDLIGPNNARQVKAQLHQVEELESAPGLVLMTIGGNDIGFADIVTKCVKPGDCSKDKTFTDKTFTDIASLQTSLELSYRAVHGTVNSPSALAERDGTAAPIVVLAYPQVLPDWIRASCSGFSAREVQFANQVVDKLDATIEKAVATVSSEGVPVYFAGHVQDAVLPNHTACSEDPFINPVNLVKGLVGKATGSDVELVHPNDSGYRAIANALVAWSQTDPQLPADVVFAHAQAPMLTETSAPSVTINMSADSHSASAVKVEAGSAIEVNLEGFAPGTSVTITVQSAPRAIASLPTDGDGKANGVVYIPADMTAGSHTLVASGLDPEFNVLTHSQALKVVQHRPWWFWPATGLSGVLLLGGIVTILWFRKSGKKSDSPSDLE